jgi:hypothetical protein
MLHSVHGSVFSIQRCECPAKSQPHHRITTISSSPAECGGFVWTRPVTTSRCGTGHLPSATVTALKYEWIVGFLPDLFKKDSASALAVCNKLLVNLKLFYVLRVVLSNVPMSKYYSNRIHRWPGWVLLFLSRTHITCYPCSRSVIRTGFCYARVLHVWHEMTHEHSCTWTQLHQTAASRQWLISHFQTTASLSQNDDFIE